MTFLNGSSSGISIWWTHYDCILSELWPNRTANGNRIERKFDLSVGRGLALSAQRGGAKSVIPFSSFHRFQREDSAWANAYEVPLSGYRQGFDERLAEFIPPFVWIDCASEEILNLHPPEAPFVLHKPEEFGDSWSDELSSEDRRVIDEYFHGKEMLHDMLGFISFEVGGKSHTINLAGPRDRGITFAAPRNSLMTAVTHSVFDDLEGANFMRVTLHNLESLYSPASLYSPSFNAVVGKWGDNGSSETKRQIKSYLAEYRSRVSRTDWFLHTVALEGEPWLRRYVRKGSPLYSLARAVYRRALHGTVMRADP